MSPKRKAFVAAFLKDQNATKAAIAAGYAEGSAHVTGHRLLNDAKVAEAIGKAQDRALDKAEMTLAGHLATLATLRDEARSAGQFSAAVKAEENRGKVSGLYTERVEHSGTVNMSAEQREQSVLLLLRQAKERKQKGMVS